MLKKLLPALCLAAACSAATVYAQDPDSLDKDVSLSELSWIDQKYFEKQRQQVDDMGRENFGTRLRQNTSDLKLLQRILDGQHLTIFETEKHKAFGIALGDIYVAEHGWEWKEYKDKQGRSHGVCVPKTQECVFPLSMFTRRLRVTTELDIQRIYQKGLDLMANVTPKLPYSAAEEPEQTPTERRDKRSIVVPFL
ncbi:MAG TPA: DUF3806 domain-containing protein [Marinagarivorans sp.]